MNMHQWDGARSSRLHYNDLEVKVMVDSMTVFRSGEVYANQCKSQAEGKMGTLKFTLFKSAEAIYGLDGSVW
jgi:hypothetical protein